MKKLIPLVLTSLASLLLGACPTIEPITGDTCLPGTSRCDQNSYQRCSDDGERWVVIADCVEQEKICILNTGCLACSPNTVSCGEDGADVVLCRDDGSGADVIGRCDPEAGLVCGLGGECQDACEIAEATRSYEGCEYWAVDLDNAVVANLGAAAAQQFSVVVTNPLELPATVTVEVNDAPLGEPPQIRVVAEAHLARIEGGGDLAILDLPPREVDGSSLPQLNDGTGTHVSSNAYRIRSTAPIVAYQFNPLSNVGVFSNDASLLLPTTALDGDYMVMGWPQTLATTDDPATNADIDLRSTLTIVGQEAETHVRVDLTTRILGGNLIGALEAGESLELTIGPFDVINLETDDFNADFTGTVITANKGVTVFSGSEASDVPFFDTFAVRQCCADHLEEALFPTSALGTHFVAVKTPLRTKYVDAAGWNVSLVEDEPEYWRVVGTAEQTIIGTSLPPPNNTFTLFAGESVTFETDRDFVLGASQPVIFGQFPASQQTTGIPSVVDGRRAPGGDPSMMIVPPVQQWRDKYVFLVPNKYAFDFLLIAMPASSGILLDGEPLADVNPRCEYKPAGRLNIGEDETEFIAIRCPLSDPEAADPNNPLFQDDGRHVVQSTDGAPIGLMVYGWDSFVSYGYPGGTNLAIINPQ
jgi:hypothetical protein